MKDKPGAPWFGAFAAPWPGGAALYRQSADNDFLSALSAAPATFGRLVDDLPAAPSGRWIEQSMRVRLSSGILASHTPDEVLSGANVMAVQSENGVYEVLQFQSAEIVGDHEWVLTGLLRGQAGSELEASVGASAGARVVRLTPLANNALVQPDFPLDLVNIPLTWRGGRDQSLPSSALFTEKQIVLTGRNLKPLSPVHIRAKKVAGDIRIDWIRRTRLGGDNWAVEEVPLSEIFERYRLEIFSGDAVLRTIDVDAPSYLYGSADQSFDLAALPPGGGVFVRVSQLSDSVGSGPASYPLRLS